MKNKLNFLKIKKMKKIFGHNWYYYMLPKDDKYTSLFSVIPRSSLLNKFVVCWDHYDEINKKCNKLYSYFDSYIKFTIYFLKLKQKSRCFYEIIFGEKIQKPHFDIDMELTEAEINIGLDKKVVHDLITQIVKLIPEINLKRDICIYSSHGKFKKSYHIIINHFYHSNHENAKAFYYIIMKNLPKEYYENNWIDHSVYSKTQQFRIYGSQKNNSDRVKIFHDEWEFNGEKILHQTDEEWEDTEMKFLINLNESLIGARISDCKALPNYEVPVQFQRKTYTRGDDIEHDLAMEALILFAETVNMTPDSKNFPYRFDRVDSSFVLLRRVKASKCKMCKRIHQHENPYLLISEDLNVFFHCRRAPPNKKLYIGTLKQEEEKEFKVFDIVTTKAPENDGLSQIQERLKKLANKEMLKKEKKKLENTEKIVLNQMKNKLENGEYV